MTQISRPWAGTTIGDAGPYTAPNWWDVWQSIMGNNGALVGADNLGVFYAVPGRLAPSSTGNNNATIAVGAAMLDGLFYYNDASVSFVIPSAAAGNLRADRIVLRKAFAAATQTARLTRLVGVEIAAPGPAVAPTITQDTTRTTFWDIPISTIGVTDGGVITVTDERSWIDATLKQVYVPSIIAYDLTAAGYIYTSSRGVTTISPNLIGVEGMLMALPLDYLENAAVEVVVYNSGGPDPAVIRVSAANVYRNREGVDEISVTTPIAGSDVSLVLNVFTYICNMALSNIQAGDILHVVFQRDGSHVNDTATTVDVTGAVLTYLGKLYA